MPKRKMILKGIPASAGVVKGKVKIILNPSDRSKMKEGDICFSRTRNSLRGGNKKGNEDSKRRPRY